MRPLRIRILEKKNIHRFTHFPKRQDWTSSPSVMHTNFILLTLNGKAYMITNTKPFLIEPSLYHFLRGSELKKKRGRNRIWLALINLQSKFSVFVSLKVLIKKNFYKRGRSFSITISIFTKIECQRYRQRSAIWIGQWRQRRNFSSTELRVWEHFCYLWLNPISN